MSCGSPSASPSQCRAARRSRGAQRLLSEWARCGCKTDGTRWTAAAFQAPGVGGSLLASVQDLAVPRTRIHHPPRIRKSSKVVCVVGLVEKFLVLTCTRIVPTADLSCRGTNYCLLIGRCASSCKIVASRYVSRDTSTSTRRSRQNTHLFIPGCIPYKNGWTHVRMSAEIRKCVERCQNVQRMVSRGRRYLSCCSVPSRDQFGRKASGAT